MKHGLGALPGKLDIRDYHFKKKVYMSYNYPDTYECPGRMKIKDQGKVGSCVAHSASEILEYHYPGLNLSTNFIYGIHHKLYGSNGPGMYLRNAAKIMLKYGDPEYDFCPGNTEVEEVYGIANATFANSEAMLNAKDHRIHNFTKVSDINDIKYALVNYGPVMGAITWYSNNTVSRVSGLLKKGDIEAGGHAIVIKGWTEKG